MRNEFESETDYYFRVNRLVVHLNTCDHLTNNKIYSEDWISPNTSNLCYTVTCLDCNYSWARPKVFKRLIMDKT